MSSLKTLMPPFERYRIVNISKTLALVTEIVITRQIFRLDRWSWKGKGQIDPLHKTQASPQEIAIAMKLSTLFSSQLNLIYETKSAELNLY